MNGYGRIVECLVICVAQHEGYVVYALAIHVVDGIAATATNTNHLDDAVFLDGLAKVEQYVIVCHIS